MRIAIPYNYGKIAPQFSNDAQFKIYDVTNSCVGNQSVISTTGGHNAVSNALSSLGVDTLICGSIGKGAKNALTQAGITLCTGVNGGADEAVKAYLAGNLSSDKHSNITNSFQG